MIGGETLKIMADEEIEFPSKQEAKSFIEKYMKECKGLFHDWNEEGIDSFDHIYMEGVIGNMIHCIQLMLPRYLEEDHDKNMEKKEHVDGHCFWVNRMYLFYAASKRRLQELIGNSV